MSLFGQLSLPSYRGRAPLETGVRFSSGTRGGEGPTKRGRHRLRVFRHVFPRPVLSHRMSNLVTGCRRNSSSLNFTQDFLIYGSVVSLRFCKNYFPYHVWFQPPTFYSLGNSYTPTFQSDPTTPELRPDDTRTLQEPLHV